MARKTTGPANCSSCGKAFDGVIVECFMHDGKFCQDCEPCSVHEK